jgi:hypothetical protein
MSEINPNNPISQKHFNALVGEFQELATKIFGCQCTIQIRGLMQTKCSPTIVHDCDRLDCIEEKNRNEVIFESYDLSAVTSEMLARVTCIEVTISPMNVLTATVSGHIEFNSDRYRRVIATFDLITRTISLS